MVRPPLPFLLRFFLPGYLFFCEEGMWGIYHRVLAFVFRLLSGLFYKREAEKTDGRGLGDGGGRGSRLNVRPGQWGSYVTHPEARGRHHSGMSLMMS